MYSEYEYHHIGNHYFFIYTIQNVSPLYIFANPNPLPHFE